MCTVHDAHSDNIILPTPGLKRGAMLCMFPYSLFLQDITSCLKDTTPRFVGQQAKSKCFPGRPANQPELDYTSIMKPTSFSTFFSASSSTDLDYTSCSSDHLRLVPMLKGLHRPLMKASYLLHTKTYHRVDIVFKVFF